MIAQLVCRVRRGLTLTFDLRADEMFVGREKGVAISVPMKGVSRRHAKIKREGEDFFIEDLFSTNGTFLNGEAVVRAELWHLDVITLGREADLVFVERTRPEAGAKRQGILTAALAHGDPEEVDEIAMGELTLGRSTACNIVVEAAAVSKMHARIERTAGELILADLGSANGTFVNGVRHRTTLLGDGDVISLAGVESFKVRVKYGEVKTTSSPRPRFTPTPDPARKQQSFPQNWKTRFDWNLEEYQKYVEEVRRERGLTRGAAEPPVEVEKPVEKPAVPVKAEPPPPVEKPKAPPAEAPPQLPGIRRVFLTAQGVSLEVSTPGPYLVGRAKDVPLRIDDKSVSRVHARILLSDDRSQVLVQDMGSVNGTKLNRQPVRKLTPLKTGDVITLGLVELAVKVEKT